MNENKQAEPVAWEKTKGGAYVCGDYTVSERVDGKGWNARTTDRTVLLAGTFLDCLSACEADIHHPAPAVAQEPVGEVKAKQGNTGTFVLWYKQPQLGDKLYTEPPAVAVNEQMLEALKNVAGWSQSPNRYIPDRCIDLINAAIEAAEQMKGGV